jgi:hypothetical protein
MTEPTAICRVSMRMSLELEAEPDPVTSSSTTTLASATTRINRDEPNWLSSNESGQLASH